MAAEQSAPTTAPAITPERLQEVHQDLMRFRRERRPLPDLWVFEDFRAALAVPTEASGTIQNARQQVLTAAKKAGVRVVMFANHESKPDEWRGLRDDILFISALETTNGDLRLPASGTDQKALSFLGLKDKRPEVSPAGFSGIEISSLSADENSNTGFGRFLKEAAASPDSWQKALEQFRKYPEEMFALAAEYRADAVARWDDMAQKGSLTGIASSHPFRINRLNEASLDPYEISFRHLSTHILARELTEPEIRQALLEGHIYVSHDSLCDPTGFAFGAHNNLGTFPMGDRALMWEKTQVTAFTPLAAKLKLFHNGTLVYQTNGTNLSFTAKAPGAYRLEAWLTVGGEDRPWIYSNPVYLEKPGWSALPWPSMDLSAPVDVTNNLTYADGKPEDANKHKLDLYLPRAKNLAPVFIFFHGGAWRTGDRGLYPALGYRFAKEGIITVVPSYRLGPKNKHPAQVEDAAAAFAWTIQHIAAVGGDTNRIYVGGHSAGGHMAALLALDAHLLAAHKLSPKNIHGVISLSGVFDLDIGESQAAVFGRDPSFRKNASPINHITSSAPPFLVAYCQWDYVPLGAQALRFSKALQEVGVPVKLHFTPHENHISEVIALTHDDDPTAKALLHFLQ
ncbi:MAG: nlhH 1 [Verrucomicrobiales bacterium]|nr:nlhH 1 [Verrucomicrobiales bacterium]